MHTILMMSRSLVTQKQVIEALERLIDYLRERGSAINPKKVQDLAQEVTFLGTIWSGSVKIISQKVIDTVQQLKVPTTKAEGHSFDGDLETAHPSFRINTETVVPSDNKKLHFSMGS